MHTHMNGGRRLSDGRPAVACISIFLATLSLSDLSVDAGEALTEATYIRADCGSAP